MQFGGGARAADERGRGRRWSTSSKRSHKADGVLPASWQNSGAHSKGFGDSITVATKKSKLKRAMLFLRNGSDARSAGSAAYWRSPPRCDVPRQTSAPKVKAYLDRKCGGGEVLVEQYIDFASTPHGSATHAGPCRGAPRIATHPAATRFTCMHIAASRTSADGPVLVSTIHAPRS